MMHQCMSQQHQCIRHLPQSMSQKPPCTKHQSQLVMTLLHQLAIAPLHQHMQAPPSPSPPSDRSTDPSRSLLLSPSDQSSLSNSYRHLVTPLTTYTSPCKPGPAAAYYQGRRRRRSPNHPTKSFDFFGDGGIFSPELAADFHTLGKKKEKKTKHTPCNF